MAQNNQVTARSSLVAKEVRIERSSKAVSIFSGSTLPKAMMVGALVLYFIAMVITLGISSKNVMVNFIPQTQQIPVYMGGMVASATALTTAFVGIILLINIGIVPILIGYGVLIGSSLIVALVNFLYAPMLNLFDATSNIVFFAAVLPVILITAGVAFAFLFKGGKRRAPALFLLLLIAFGTSTLFGVMMLIMAFATMPLGGLILLSVLPAVCMIIFDMIIKLRFNSKRTATIVTIAKNEWTGVVILGSLLSSFFTWNIDFSGVTVMIVVAFNVLLIAALIALTVMTYHRKMLKSLNMPHIYILAMIMSIAVSAVAFFPEDDYRIPSMLFFMPGLLMLTVGTCMALTNYAPNISSVSTTLAIATMLASVFGLASIFVFTLELDLTITRFFMGWDVTMLAVVGVMLAVVEILYITKVLIVKKIFTKVPTDRAYANNNNGGK